MKTIENIVTADVEEYGQDYLQSICDHGCVSGVVGGLIYYRNTLKFYTDHKDEINNLLTNIIEETGMNIFELFGDKLDVEDPLFLETQNQNLLAWFGYEEIARKLMDEI